MISEGAEAKVYSMSAFGGRFIAKIRERKTYRVRELDLNIRKERTRNEARIMKLMYDTGLRVPRVFAVGAFSIYMERLEGKLLKDIKISKEALIGAGNLLAEMHNNGVSHGDFTPANLMLCKDGVYLIDFGLSETTKGLEEKAIDLLLMKKSISKKDYEIFKRTYLKKCLQHREILERLEDIELRGRYQIRTLA